MPWPAASEEKVAKFIQMGLEVPDPISLPSATLPVAEDDPYMVRSIRTHAPHVWCAVGSATTLNLTRRLRTTLANRVHSLVIRFLGLSRNDE